MGKRSKKKGKGGKERKKRLKSGLCRDHARSTEVKLKERGGKKVALHRIEPVSTDTKG